MYITRRERFCSAHNLLNEKIVYERENQIDSFKTKTKPIMGRSINEEEFSNILKLK